MPRVEPRRCVHNDGRPLGVLLWFLCPGCGAHHAPRVENLDGSPSPTWTWNGDVERPTLQPSLLVTWEFGEAREKRVCHSFVVDGRIQFLGDCTHALAGQTVDLPEYSR